MCLFQKNIKIQRERKENFLHCLINCIFNVLGEHKSFKKHKDEFCVMWMLDLLAWFSCNKFLLKQDSGVFPDIQPSIHAISISRVSLLCLSPTAVSVTSRVSVFFLCTTFVVLHRGGEREGDWLVGFALLFIYLFLQTESNNTLRGSHTMIIMSGM